MSDENRSEEISEEDVTELYSDSEIRKAISRASEGNLSAAWLLIHHIKTALEDRTVSEPLFDYAAAFFEALLAIENNSESGAAPRKLAQAFGKLHIVRDRGQPARTVEKRYKLAAHVFLLEHAGFSTDAALNALESLDGQSRKALRTAAEEARTAWQEEEEATTEELEDLAGVTQHGLLNLLGATGAITEQQKQAAATAAALKRAELRARRDMIDRAINKLRSAKK